MLDKDNRKGIQVNEIFKKQSDSTAFNLLEKRFNKAANTWCERYKSLRVLAFLTSWGFNFISAAGISYLVYHAAKSFSAPHSIALVFSVVFLVLFELLKRKTSDLFWDDFVETKTANIGLGIVNFVIMFGLSLAGTYYGYNQGTKDFSPEYQAQKTTSEIDRIDNEILKLETENKEVHQATRDKSGQMRWNNEKMHTKNNERIAELNLQADEERAKLEALNLEHGTEFEKGVTLGIDTIIAIAIGSEIAFEFLMWFMSFFDFRKRLELALSLGIPIDQVLNTSTLYSSTGSQTISTYQQIPTASKTAASQPISENKRKIGFEIPKKRFKPTQTQVTQADTQATQKEVTQPETRVARDTQPDTGFDTTISAPPQKDPDYIVKMKKRIRERWAKSFENHPRARKSEAGRKHLRDLAIEEWKELEELGYLIRKDTSLNPWGLEIVSPQKQKRHGLT